MTNGVEVMDDVRCDVAIVGFGPSGSVAAALLARLGHRVWVGDRLADVYDKPRAIALDHEILRVFQELGLDEAVAAHTEPFTDSCYYGVDGQLIRRMTMLAPPYPQAWTPSVVFDQPSMERALRAVVAQLPGATVQLGAEVVALAQDETGATITLADGARVRARYVVGCDGASGRVRAWAGLPLEDLGFDEPWLVVDVLANDRGLARLPRHSVQYCEPHRPCTYIIGPGRHRRWEISLRPGEDPAQAATPAGTWALLKRWITPEDGQLWRQASYRFHALVAQRWREGRVLIAADAAHQQPPFLGQGMCQGIRDVANLTWKLDAVLRGLAGDALLDSYGSERQAHVRELTRRLKAIGAVIGERDEARARARDARLLEEVGGQVAPTARQDVLPRLEVGVLASSDTPGRGVLFPQAWLKGAGQVERMDQRLGRGWRLFTRSLDVAPSPAGVVPALHAHALEDLDEVDGVLAQWFERMRCRAALVRPDHYVFGTADDLAGVNRLLDEASRWYSRPVQTTGD